MIDQILRVIFGSDPSGGARRRPRHGTVRQRPAKAGGAGRRASSAASARYRQAQSLSGTVTVYHGTPTRAAALSILRHGWVIGNGNLLGDGVYVTTSLQLARGYSGPGGYIVKARLQPGRCAQWSPRENNAFASWCAARRCPQDNSARTAFLLERGYRTLKKDNVFVVLQRGYRNPAATKVRLRCLKIVEVIEAGSGRRVTL